MFRSKYLDIIILLSLLVILIMLSNSYSLKKNKDIFNSPLIGTIFPDFSLRDLEGRYVSSETLLNDESDIKVINFFASWCPSCLHEHSLINAINNNLNIPIYGFAWKDNKYELDKYLFENQNPYKHVMQIDNNIYMSQLLNIRYIPMSLVIDKDNKVIAHFKGPITSANFNYFLETQKP
ncbi:MAG: redoxin family protein [Rickettsiales bacterium]|nr:redoxin family protein [Rickettsiales bacterium]